MTAQWITADRVFDGHTILTDHAVLVDQGRVMAISPTSQLPADANSHHITGLLAPGFVDLQVNGGGGVLLNTTTTLDGLQAIAAAHRAFGTVGILPTVITDRPEVLESAADALLSLTEGGGIYGLHIEGPHIASTRRGTHAAEHIRPYDDLTRNTVAALRGAGWPVLITVAPETLGPGTIPELVEMGAVVSLGHSAASYEQTLGALAEGATGFTHLYNAMGPLESRAPGIIGAAIGSQAWCGIIADGVHVHSEMVRLACRGRPRGNRMIAVSDAMATVGGPDSFELYGQTIQRDGNRLVNAEGALAGAHLTLAEALRNLIAYGLSVEDALRMCRQNPLEFMQMQQPAGVVGLPAQDLIRLDDDYTVLAVGLQEILSPD